MRARHKVRQYEAWAIGAAAGLVDAVAMPELVPRAIPFSMTLYAVGGAAVFGVARLLFGLFLDRTRAIRLALGLETAGLVLLFAAYRVITARGGFFATGDGAKLGILLGLLAAVGAGVLVHRIWSDRPVHLSLRFALALILVIWPLLTLVELVRGPGEPGRGLVLVSMDAARGDRVSALGYPRPTTPNLDALLEDGIAWTNAVVQCPASGPSHATMLTGLPPLAHQVLFNADILGEEVLTVAERIRAAGFATAAFADNFYIDSRYGFDQGFDTFVNEFRASAVQGWNAHHLLRTTVVYHVWYRLTRTPGQKNTDSLDGAIQWLRTRPPGDWFLFLHLMDPHAPYDAPAAIRDRFYSPEGEPVRDTVELRSRLEAASDTEIAALENLYDASIALADQKLGILIDEMKSLGLMENSLIVVTADHGEVLAENGPVFDHGLPDQGNLHVPLVMGGGRAPGTVGQRVGRVVSTTSWVTTAFAALELEYREQGMQTESGPLPLAETDVVPVYGMTGITDLDRSYALDGSVKLLLGPQGIAGCFDLSEDPLERADLCAEGVAPSLDKLEEGLLTWLEETAAAGIVAGRQSDQDFDAATREQLKALGYIE